MDAADTVAVKFRPSNSLIEPLTSLRFFAAMAVVFFHSGSSWVAAKPFIPAPFKIILLNGFLGVTFFFVLSGFILQYIYAEKWNSQNSLKKFFTARFARIYPAYLLSLLFVVSFFFAASWTAIPQFFLLQSWVPTDAIRLENWNMPAWTLSVEFAFYLCFPLFSPLAARASSTLLGLVVSACVLFALITRSPTMAGAGSAPMEWMQVIPLPLLRLPEFVLGVCAAEFVRRGGTLRRLPAWAVILVLILALGMTGSKYVAVVVTVSAALLCIIFSTNPDDRLSPVLSHPILVFLGGASYSIYLLHQGVHFSMEHLAGRGMLGLVLQYPVLVVLGACVFRYIEEPLRERLRFRAHLPASAYAEVAGIIDTTERPQSAGSGAEA